MRHSLTRIAIAFTAVALVAAIWLIPSSVSAQQVPGTLAQPGMTNARVWINNQTREESIPVHITNTDPKALPLPVALQGVPAVSVNGLVEARTTSSKQSWEYRSVSTGVDQDLAPVLNGLGGEGWEAVGLTSQPGAKVTVLLKRPR